MTNTKLSKKINFYSLTFYFGLVIDWAYYSLNFQDTPVDAEWISMEARQ